MHFLPLIFLVVQNPGEHCHYAHGQNPPHPGSNGILAALRCFFFKVRMTTTMMMMMMMI
jgi:hypothetical protein